MRKLVKSKAEEQFTAALKKDKKVLEEKEKSRLQRAEHAAKLKALRMAKMDADKKAAE